MREIKFRGKVKYLDMACPPDGWVEGFYYQDLVNGTMKHFIKCYEMDFEVQLETVEQFTGLHDKNGKEIYEGDIVQFIAMKFGRGIPEIGYVRWSKDECCWIFVNKYSTTDHRELVRSLISCRFNLEIIGNIHDNTELLNK